MLRAPAADARGGGGTARLATRPAPHRRWAGGRRSATAALALGSLLLASACSRRAEPQAPERGGTLRVAVFEPFDLPSPLFGMGPTTAQFVAHVTPPLGRVDEQGTVRLCLASRSADAGAYIDYTLRPLRWEDGVPVAPRDLVLTATLLGDPRVRSPERSRVELMRGCSATDDSTVRLEYLTIYGRRIRDSLLMPLPAHRAPANLEALALRGASFSARPLACGPFRLAQADSRRLLLVRSDGSGFPAARLDSVAVDAREVDGAVEDFLGGKLDVLDDLPAGRIPDVSGRRDARVVGLVGESYLFVGWNLRDGRFADPAVRRAAAQAVDVARLGRELCSGLADPARGPLTALLGFADTTAVLRHDPRAAARALENAGWRAVGPGGVRERRGARLAFHLLAPADDPLRIAAARGVARDLEHVGMAVEVRLLPTPVLVSRLDSHAFEAFVGQWYPGPGFDLDQVWRSDATDQRNYVGYANPAADSLLTRMQHELAEETRARLLSRFQALVYADQPYLFLFQKPHFLVLSRRVRGAEPTIVSPFWNLPEWWIPRRLRAARG